MMDRCCKQSLLHRVFWHKGKGKKYPGKGSRRGFLFNSRNFICQLMNEIYEMDKVREDICTHVHVLVPD